MVRDFRGSRIDFDDIYRDVVVIIHGGNISLPCRQVLSMIEEAAKEFPRVDFLKVFYRDHRYLEHELGLKGLPTVIFLKNGRYVDSFMGVPPYEELLLRLVKNY